MQVIILEKALEDQVFDLREKALELYEQGQIESASALMQQVWALLPEPKVETNCTGVVLIGMYQIAKASLHFQAIKPLLQAWVDFTQHEQYPYHTAFILLAETHFYLGEFEQGMAVLRLAKKCKIAKRAFSEHPDFYYQISMGKLKDLAEIEKLFKEYLATAPVMQPELDEETIDLIDDLAEQGNEFEEQGQLAQAQQVWQQALDLIPEPKQAFAQASWLQTALGDLCFQQQDYAQALALFSEANGNLEAEPNAFILLRLGQLYRLQQQEASALEYLLRAYMLEGEEIFVDEGDTLAFLSQRVALDKV